MFKKRTQLIMAINDNTITKWFPWNLIKVDETVPKSDYALAILNTPIFLNPNILLPLWTSGKKLPESYSLVKYTFIFSCH